MSGAGRHWTLRSLLAAAISGALLASADILLGAQPSAASALAAMGLGFLAATLLASAFLGVGRWLGSRLSPRHVRLLALLAALVAGVLFVAGRLGTFELYPRLSMAGEWTAFALATLSCCALVQGQVHALVLPLAGVLALATLTFVREDDPRVARALFARPLPAALLGGLRGLLDVDRDGYAGLLGGGDCAPFDGAISPGRAELPHNGRDDNCLLGDGSAPDALGGSRAAGVPRSEPVSVVLITIDSLRPDHTTPYGAAPDVTPALAGFAKRALTFDRAYTSGGWTSIALSSLFRGRNARELQWTAVHETDTFELLRESQLREQPGARVRKAFALPLVDPRPTLPQLLQAHGVRTAAVLDDGLTRYFQEKRGAFPGYDIYVHGDLWPEDRRDDRGTSDAALRILRLYGERGPLFLWVHYFGPHSPSTRHAGVPGWGSSAEARYDHEVRFFDRQLGRVIDALDALAAKIPFAVLIAADHGEEFGPALRHHGQTLREAAIRIPVLLRAPGVTARRSAEPVSLVDVMPTVLNLLGVPAPAGLVGSDLVAIAGGARPARVVFADTWRFALDHEPELDLACAIDRQHKLVWDVRRHSRWLVRAGDRTERDVWSAAAARHLEQAVSAYLERAPRAIQP